MVRHEEAGVSNYWLPVYPADCQDCKTCAPELLLWFFDSRGGYRYQELDENGEKVSQNGRRLRTAYQVPGDRLKGPVGPLPKLGA